MSKVQPRRVVVSENNNERAYDQQEPEIARSKVLLGQRKEEEKEIHRERREVQIRVN
jgi:hypothetical protein